jgi:hypothetical protein
VDVLLNANIDEIDNYLKSSVNEDDSSRLKKLYNTYKNEVEKFSRLKINNSESTMIFSNDNSASLNESEISLNSIKRIIFSIKTDLILEAKRLNIKISYNDIKSLNSFQDLENSGATISKFSKHCTELNDLFLFFKLRELFGDSSIYYSFFRDFRGRFYAYCQSHPIINRVGRAFLKPYPRSKELPINSFYFNKLNSLKIAAVLVPLTKSFNDFEKNLSKYTLFYVNVLLLEIFKF